MSKLSKEALKATCHSCLSVDRFHRLKVCVCVFEWSQVSFYFSFSSFQRVSEPFVSILGKLDTQQLINGFSSPVRLWFTRAVMEMRNKERKKWLDRPLVHLWFELHRHQQQWLQWYQWRRKCNCCYVGTGVKLLVSSDTNSGFFFFHFIYMSPWPF